MPTLPPFPMIAVDDQPSTILIKDSRGKDLRVDNFARWKARGVDTLYRSQKDELMPNWVQRAATAGLQCIPTVPFLPDGTVDAVMLGIVDSLPHVIGWTFEDEADRRSAIRPNPPITFARMQVLVAQYRAATAKPLFLTFTGGGGGFDNEYYKGDAAGQASIGGPGHKPPGWFALPDVIVWDYHLYATARATHFEIHDRMQDRAHEWSGGKPQVIYIEASPQNLENKARPGPTAAQWQELMDRRIARAKEKGHDLRGFIQFPQKIDGGFMFDNVQPDVAALMPTYFASLRPATPDPVPAPPPVPETPPPPAYVTAAQVREMIADALQAQQLRFYDTVLKPLQDLTDVHTKQLLAMRKNLAEAVAEGG